MGIHIFLLASFFLLFVPLMLLSILGGTKCISLLLAVPDAVAPTIAMLSRTLSRVMTRVVVVIWCCVFLSLLTMQDLFKHSSRTITEPSLAPGIGFDLSTSYG